LTLPLEGIRIIEMTRAQQGPFSTVMLADMGAEVIKIEEPSTGELSRGITRGDATAANPYFEAHNRGKKGITVNVKSEKGREIVYRLAASSDVFVQNLRPGVVEKLGVDYKHLSQYNPKIIYASASGYGRTGGPEAYKPSFDLAAQAAGGIMTVTGWPGSPPTPMVIGIADQTGAMMLSWAILVALLARERLGIGQELDVSLLGTEVNLQSWHYTAYSMTGQFPPASTNIWNRPFWNIYQAKDRWFVLSGGQHRAEYWEKLCRAIGREELANDPRFDTSEKRVGNQELVDIFREVFRTRTAAEWLSILNEQDIICALVRDYGEVMDDPQALAQGYIIEHEHPTMGKIKLPGVPAQLSKTPGQVRASAPELGQHTEEVLTEVAGYTWEELEQLRDDGVI